MITSRIILVVAFVAALNSQSAAVGGHMNTAQQVAALAAAPPETELFVRQALEDRIAARNFPDGDFLRTNSRVAILDELPTSRLKLGPAALPQREGYEFYFISAATAQTTADSSGKPVFFLIADSPSINGETGSLRLGLDVANPQRPNPVKLCCCSARGEFRRVADRWTFVKWGEWVCM